MIVFLGLLVVGVVGAWVMHRRSRAERLGGLTAERPVFSVTPPPGRLGRRSDGRL